MPERVFIAGGGGENGHAAGSSQGLLGMLISLLVAEKSGFQPVGGEAFAGLEEVTARMTRDAMESIEAAVAPRASEALTANPAAKAINRN